MLLLPPGKAGRAVSSRRTQSSLCPAGSGTLYRNPRCHWGSSPAWFDCLRPIPVSTCSAADPVCCEGNASMSRQRNQFVPANLPCRKHKPRPVWGEVIQSCVRTVTTNNIGICTSRCARVVMITLRQTDSFATDDDGSQHIWGCLTPDNQRVTRMLPCTMQVYAIPSCACFIPAAAAAAAYASLAPRRVLRPSTMELAARLIQLTQTSRLPPCIRQ